MDNNLNIIDQIVNTKDQETGVQLPDISQAHATGQFGGSFSYKKVMEKTL